MRDNKEDELVTVKVKGKYTMRSTFVWNIRKKTVKELKKMKCWNATGVNGIGAWFS